VYKRQTLDYELCEICQSGAVWALSSKTATIKHPK
jgi:hypothetical protein